MDRAFTLAHEVVGNLIPNASPRHHRPLEYLLDNETATRQKGLNLIRIIPFAECLRINLVCVCDGTRDAGISSK